MPSTACPIAGCDFVTADVQDAAERIALLTIHATTHNNTAVMTAKPEKVSRPKIANGSSSEDWQYFIQRWGDYKAATKISGNDIKIQLMECCEESLRRDLHRSDKSISSKDENVISSAIRKLAVREENTMVSRVLLQSMHQDRDEGVRNFAARLNGQADICKYIAHCDCGSEINFTEQMVRDTLIRGLEDPEIRQNILGHENQDMALEAVLKLIEAKESGKRSEASLLGADQAHGSSTYKSNKKSQKGSKRPTCMNCGEPCHEGGNSLENRKKHCKAFGNQCNNCGKRDHFAKVCFSRKKEEGSIRKEEKEEAGMVYDMLCSISNTAKPIILQHHIFSPDGGWERRNSRPQPHMQIQVRVEDDDYIHLGHATPKYHRTSSLTAIADTGCQSSLMSLKMLHSIGVKKSELIPVTMQMKAINQKSVEILGAVLLRLSSKDKEGKLFETPQLVYVTNSTDKFYISCETCIGLGLISENFPSTGEAAEATISTEAKECSCPKHTLPPPLPTKLPFPATEENVPKLKDWLLKHYGSSTFNTCEHQVLPSMEGPPLKLNIDPNAKPIAVHTPIPVPLHWQEEVKAGLDRDVRLGVLEPVPVGEPVTWCHRMVICRKKNSKLRRTVDMQSLNAHSTRETHHTLSPFHQVTLIPKGKKKSVFDAWNGYHSVPIRECDRHYTTFISPWGRYRYCSAPQGYAASQDGYSRRFDEIVSDFPNKTKCIDDTCAWTDDIEGSFFQACNWLDLCGRNGIILNPEKFQFAQDEVEFAGFDVDLDSIKPCKKLLQAIDEFPVPKSLTDIRAWFGLINQVSFYESLTEEMKPFRELLKPSKQFYWDSHMQYLFDK